VNVKEIYSFLLFLYLQTGHERLLDYNRTVQYALFGTTMKVDKFFHILRYLHFTDNRDEPDKRDDNFDILWKMKSISDMLNDAYAKYYSPTEHLAVDEITVLFKVRVVFKQYIPMKHERFGIKIYKLCDSKGYAYDMRVCLGKDRTYATDTMTATHTTVVGLTRKLKM
jgi:hypothetical protein